MPTKGDSPVGGGYELDVRTYGWDYYAEQVFDRMGEGLREAIDSALRHWHGFHLERAGQLPFPGLERPHEEIDVGACLGAVS